MNYRNKLLALTALCLIAPGIHATIIRITVAGELNLSNGTDVNNLDGASFAAEYQYDSAATFIDDTIATSFFVPLFAEIDFSSRPNGAADTTLAYQSPDRPLLVAENKFAPSPENDSVNVQSRTLESSVEFPVDLSAPSFIFDLGTQEFFSGQLAPVELVFNSADVSAFSATDFRFFSPNGTYEVTGAIFSVTVVEDSDSDGVDDFSDNCVLAPNGPDLPDAGGLIQYDSDADGFGNACDPDLNNDNIVDFGDLPALQSAFFSVDVDPNWNPDADQNGDGVVDFGDLSTFQLLFFGPPGPSGIVPP